MRPGSYEVPFRCSLLMFCSSQEVQLEDANLNNLKVVSSQVKLTGYCESTSTIC
jgi:hypothetical protein